MNEIVHPITTADYRARPGINQSTLSWLEQSPAHLAYHRDHPKEPTADMEFGSLCDHLMFGGDFAYEESPHAKYQSNEAKAYKAAKKEAGIAVFQPERIADARTIIERLRNRKSVSDIMARGRAQVAMFWKQDDLQCKGLADYVSDTVLCIADLKTCGQSIAGDEWGKHVVNKGYDVQAAYYVDMWRNITGQDRDFCWIVAETEPPFEGRVIVAMREQIERGRLLYRRWLAQYAECVKSGNWPGYPDAWENSPQPRWASIQ